MNPQFLQPLAPILSSFLAALVADIALRLLLPAIRDRFDPLLGMPARWAMRLSEKLDRAGRGASVKTTRSLITLFVLTLIALLIGWGVHEAAPFFALLPPVCWFLCLRVTFPWSAAADLFRASDKNKLEAAKGAAVLQRRRIVPVVPVANPDQHGVIRMVIESTAVSLHRGALTPLLWGCAAVLANLPYWPVVILIVFLQEAIRVIVTASAIGQPFVAPFELAETIINFVPARVAAVFIMLAALVTPGARPIAALRDMFGQSHRHWAINSGWPLAAFAGALHVALPGGLTRNGWVGPKTASARTTIADLKRAVWLHATAVLLIVLFAAATLLLALAS
jgi:adenosylcobinamide-phosphate synthase